MRTTAVSLENRNETNLTVPATGRLWRLSLLRFFFAGDFQNLSNNAHNNTPRARIPPSRRWTGGGKFYFIYFFKYLIRLMEDNVKRPPRRRRRRFIICRQKNLFYNATSSCLRTVSIWCKFSMWIAWHARYNGLNDSGDIEKRRYSIFFFYSFVYTTNQTV